MMEACEKYGVNQNEQTNYCPTLDDYRPTHVSLLTRFARADCSEPWRTSNQDYGAFYYQTLPEYCVPDSLRTRLYRRHNRFQDWLTYQNQQRASHICSTTASNAHNNSLYRTMFPSAENDTVRVTHRKCSPNPSSCEKAINRFSPGGEDGLISEYIVKQILHKLKFVINADEYSDVAACAQLLVSDILNQEPYLLIDEIIDRVITIMVTPPGMTQQLDCNTCNLNVPLSSISCRCVQPLNANNSMRQLPMSVNNECSSAHSSDPLVMPNQSRSFSNAFENLAYLENAISKVSCDLVKS